MKHAICLLLLLSACAPPLVAPPHAEVLEVSGTPYERGLEHGRRLAPKIRSLYTRLLTASVLPVFDRERAEIASVLLTYQDASYDGRFASELFLESAYELETTIPEVYLEEMRGIADGAGLPYEQILVLNTFFDTVLGIRAVQTFLAQAQAPRLLSVTVLGAGEDGRDNDGDGEVDEAGEGVLDPYEPSPHALLVGVAVDARLRFEFEDQDGVDPATVRVEVDGRLYAAGDAGLTATEAGERLVVELAPEGGLPPGRAVSLLVQAGDRSLVTDPPPAHARFMREQWLVLGTEGLDARPEDVANRARANDRFPPPSIAFALRGPATRGGPLVGHHFALLDSGVLHEHAVILVHRPDEGLDHVTLGWAGVVWGMSGMNEAGLVWVANVSDSLDSPLVDEVRQRLIGARLLMGGLPVGIMGREVLAAQADVQGAEAWLGTAPATGGWNVLLADPAGTLRVVELDGDILGSPDGGCHAYDPGTQDSLGRPLASVGADDLRMASHFARNTEDIELELMGMRIGPQRTWSRLWHRSLRAFHLLGDALAPGVPDVAAAIEVLRTPELVDRRDSMSAVVFEPAARRLHWAMGEVPATDAPFVPLTLEGGP